MPTGDSVTYHGSSGEEGENLNETGGVLTTGWSYSMDWSGATKGSLKRILKRGEGEAFAKSKIGSEHPQADWLICEKVAVNSVGAIDQLTLSYQGVPKDVDVVKYSADVSLSQEPIDTHPKFESFAGKPSEMVNGVHPDYGTIFDKPDDLKGSFSKFASHIGGGADEYGEPLTGAEKNGKYGVSKYLVPNITWSEEKVLGSSAFTSETAKDLAGVMEVGTRTNDVPREIFTLANATTGEKLSNLATMTRSNGTKYDWLLVSANWTKVGNGARITRKWRMSGRNGWNQDIYARHEAS